MAKNTPTSPTPKVETQERQADLRLVNLISQGLSMKEAKQRLGIVEEPPAEDAPEAEKVKYAKRAVSPLGAAEQDLL